MKGTFKYIFIVIQTYRHVIDKRFVSGSGFICSFLWNHTWLEYFLNNMFTMHSFCLIFYIWINLCIDEIICGPTQLRTMWRGNAPVGSPILLVSGDTWVPWEQRRGFRAEPPSAPFFLYVFFNLFHVPRHWELPSLWEINTFIFL